LDRERRCLSRFPSKRANRAFPAGALPCPRYGLAAWLAAVHPCHHVPHRAEIALGIVVCALVLALDLRAAIGFSSFGALVYYAIAIASACTLPRQQRCMPRGLTVLGIYFRGFSRIEAVSAGTHGLSAVAGWDRPWVRGWGLAVLAGFGRCCGVEFVVE
jgi:amino acid transporter